MHHGIPEKGYRAVLRTLGECGFEPLGAITQGSGLRGRALSADGTVWIDIRVSHSFRRGLRRFLRDGRLSPTEIALEFHTEFNDGSCLITRAAADAPAAIAAAVQDHMQALETHLLDRHPLKPTVLNGLGAVLLAEQRALRRPQQPAFNAEALCHLGVAPHLARLIAGPCAPSRETLPI
jgi:hypothetical protein